MKHALLTVPYSPDELEELRRLKPTQFATARGVQTNEVAMRLLATLDEDPGAAELERLRAVEAAARYQHETGSLHAADHAEPFRYCCAVGAALAGAVSPIRVLPDATALAALREAAGVSVSGAIAVYAGLRAQGLLIVSRRED